MKKSIVLVIVGLLSVLLLAQYLQRKNIPAAMSQAAGVQKGGEIPEGVGLPADAASYSTVKSETVERPGQGAAPANPKDAGNTIICSAGKSLNDVLSTHGREWNNFSKSQNGFTVEDNKAIYDLLTRYFSCQAAASGDLGMCDALPGPTPENVKAGGRYSSPNSKCRFAASRVLFFAYATGKLQQDNVCREFFTGEAINGPASGTSDFCRSAAKGYESLCAIAPADKKDQCRQMFPTQNSHCRTAECNSSYSLYIALKNNNISGCQGEYKTECGAFISKSASACSSVLDRLGAVYCPAANAALERKSTEEINKSLKKALGKK